MESKLDLAKLVGSIYSLLTDNLQVTTKFSSLPVINSSPTDCSNLYTALKIVQNINIICTPQNKTIVSLLHYVKCIQLQSKKKISNNFLFRLGEPHVVFAMVKRLGKYINNSGLNQTFKEPEINGPATIEQIKNGKHLKRSFEVNTTLYVALFCVYMESFVSLHPLIEKLLEGLANAAVVLENFTRKEKDVIRQNHHNLMTVLDKTNFFEEKLKFDESMENQSPYFITFMKMFENLLLLFVRSSGQCLWEGHLASLNEFIKYFFALDLKN